MTNHSHDVILVHRRDSLRPEKILQDRLFANPHINVIWDSEVVDFIGSGDPEALVGLDLRNKRTGEISRLDVEGAFVAIGHRSRQPSFSKTSSNSTTTATSSLNPVRPEPASLEFFACGDVIDTAPAGGDRRRDRLHGCARCRKISCSSGV